MDLLYQKLLPFENVIWDWNGTLLEDVDLVWQILADKMTDEGLEAMPLEEYRRIFTFPVKNFYRQIGINNVPLDDWNRFFINAYDERYKIHSDLFSGTRELLKCLQEDGKQCSILSAAEQNHLREAVTHFGIDPYMTHVFGVSSKTAEGKVQRGRDLLKHWSINPEKTVIVGDTLHDAEVGKAMGIHVLLVADGHQTYERLLQAGCPVIESRFI